MNNILILHGWGSCTKNWQRVKDRLESGGYKVFLPDLPGFGENLPLSQVWEVDDYVKWVKDYCEKNNLSQIFLLGHSFGGSIALKFALKFPQEVKKLILVDPAIVRVKDVKKEILTKIAKILKIFSFLPLYSSVRRICYKLIGSDYPDAEGPMRETYLKVIKEDLSGHLAKVSVPTLLIWGEKDKVTPVKDAYSIKEKVAGAELKILRNIHHNPQTENPELLAETVLKSL